MYACFSGSIISTHDECCEQLVQTDLSFRACIKVLKKYPGANNIVVRMGYALGNLMARSESARVKVSYVAESCGAPVVSTSYRRVYRGISVAKVRLETELCHRVESAESCAVRYVYCDGSVNGSTRVCCVLACVWTATTNSNGGRTHHDAEYALLNFEVSANSFSCRKSPGISDDTAVFCNSRKLIINAPGGGNIHPAPGTS